MKVVGFHGGYNMYNSSFYITTSVCLLTNKLTNQRPDIFHLFPPVRFPRSHLDPAVPTQLLRLPVAFAPPSASADASAILAEAGGGEDLATRPNIHRLKSWRAKKGRLKTWFLCVFFLGRGGHFNSWLVWLIVGLGWWFGILGLPQGMYHRYWG